mmetsp:Transcript_42898/g.99940  ORF Transcript_42898/g.99940 Transcript_42898/m.99940 type:complete len:691 (-) Transcript_42898:181-2253(-)
MIHDSADFLAAFLRNASGHVLPAWLRFFETTDDGDGQVSLEEFITAMRRLHFTGDAEGIFTQIDADDSGFLTLYEVDGKCADLWAAFRAWCAETFTTSEDMVTQLRGTIVDLGPPEGERRMLKRQKSAVPPIEATFIKEQFLENAPRHGWYGGFEDVLFASIDRKQTGYVTQADLPWFEKAMEQHRRRLHLRPATSRANLNGGTSGSPAQKKNAMQALLAFMSFLRSGSQGGSLMHSWRSALDRDGYLYVQKPDVIRACAQMGWRGDVSSLWSCLDITNGRASLEEFGFKEARALALFKHWAIKVAGSIKEAWQKLLLQEKLYQRKLRSSNSAVMDSLDRKAFVYACTKVTNPPPFDPNCLFTNLDWEPNGKITFRDLRFLELWEPVSWLSEQPSSSEALSFKTSMLSKYGNHPVKAWRLCLDLDGNGICKWSAFKQATERINWKGDCAKAWLGLDKRGLGFITLYEIDEEVAENLALFRRWCFANYGGVAVAFHHLDTDGSGSLSEEEFVQVIESSSFKGDAHAAWQSLNLEASDILSEREMDFLDDMELDMLTAYVSATEAAEANESHKYEGDARSAIGSPLSESRRQSAVALDDHQVSHEFRPLISTAESCAELLHVVGLSHSTYDPQVQSDASPKILDLHRVALSGEPKLPHQQVTLEDVHVLQDKSAPRKGVRPRLYAGGIPYLQ